MPDDLELKIIADVGAAVSGLDAFEQKVRSATQDVQEMGAKASAAAAGVDEVAAKTSRMELALGQASARLGAVASGMGQFGYSMSLVARAVPELGAALAVVFPVILIVAAGEAISALVEKIQKAEDEIRKVTTSWTDLGASAIESSQAIEVQNLKLEDQIAKLEGRPTTNQLKEALLEAEMEAQKLTASLASALEKTIELFEKSDVGVLTAAFEGLAATSVAFGLGDKFKDLKVQIGLASTALSQYRQAQTALEEARQRGDAAAIAAAEQRVSSTKAAADIANTAAQQAANAAAKQIELDKQSRLAALTAPTGSMLIPGAIEAGMAQADAQKQVTAEFRQQDAAVAATLTQLQQQVIQQKESATQSTLRAKTGTLEYEAAITKVLIEQHDELAKILERRTEISGQAEIAAAKTRGGTPEALAAAERRAEEQLYNQKRLDLEVQRDLAAQNEEVVRKLANDLEVLALDHAKRMEAIKATEAEGIRRQNSENAVVLEQGNRTFDELMKRRSDVYTKSSVESRVDAALIGAVELRLIEDQLRLQERMYAEGKIGRAEELADLNKSKAALVDQAAASERAITSQIDLLKSQQSESMRTLGIPSGDEDQQKRDQDNQQNVLLLQKELADSQEKYKSAINETQAVIFRLDTSTSAFFERMRSHELSAGLTWKSVADQFQLSWQKALTNVNSQFASSVGQWILHGGSFVRSMQNMGAELVAGLAEDFIRLGLVTLENWILTLLGMKVAQSTSSTGVVLAHAAEAGAAGVASWAGAPWPIDTGAPAFGASMASAALAYLPMAAAEKGAYLSADQPIFAHKGEMVLPSEHANVIKGLAADRLSSSSTSYGGNNIGRLQFQNQQFIQGSDFDADRHAGDMLKALTGQLRRKGYNL